MEQQKPGPLEFSIAGSLGVAAILTGVVAHKWLITLILLGLLLLLVGGYFAWRWWKRGHDEKNFSGEMDEQGGNANVRKAEQKAQLDSLRRAFKDGTDVYKKRKKDVYSVPWYVMIGTPASGKTEAIRHSEIGFPPGLTDPLAGVGGTINMNWWFTNYGVILDTAGKMVFPEAGGTGQTAEWDEFLKLLRKHRPACPINGLFLALDVDKMIKDPAEAIGKKASQVAQQLDRIQRALDVRFPVYLLVTKSDFLTGFKEFFDVIDDPQLQNQILGWSNPDPLDAPINPDAIEEHLRELVEVIKRRRLAVLRAPVNLDLRQNRRLDCTDAMFAFPESLERLIPRLKRYLQIIFSAGEFSAKPVFLRGIYFTSSMQQNGDLDEALAEFLRIQVTELPPANVQETAKSYFLRDMFIDKAFKERLVTSASNTSRMRRNRLLILSGLTVLILGTLVVLALLGGREYDKSVGEQKRLWQAAADPIQWVSMPTVPGKVWHPVVVPTNGNQWHYTGDDHPFLAPYQGSNLVDFQVMMQSQASHEEVPTIFKPMQFLKGVDFKQGQRVLVERSILAPLLGGASSKMTELQAPNIQDTKAVIRLRKALETLVQTQADMDKKPLALSDADLEQKLSSFITNLADFTVDQSVPVDPRLIKACAWTYSAAGAGSKDWPPASFPHATNLESDAAINNGLACLIFQVKKNQQLVETHLAALTAVCASLSALESAENTLREHALNGCALTRDDFAAWETAVRSLESSLNQGMQQHVFEMVSTGGPLQAAVNNIQAENGAASSEAFKGILTAAQGGIQVGKRPLFADIAAKCRESSGSLSSKVDAALAPYQGKLQYWDSNYLAGAGGGADFFELRNNLYTNAMALRDPTAAVQAGTLHLMLDHFKSERVAINTQVDGYSGPLKEQLQRVCKCVIDESIMRGQDGLLSNYWSGAGDRLMQYYNAPSISFADLTEAHTFFTNLESDFASQTMRELPPVWQANLQSLRGPNADLTKKALITAYTKWVQTQLRAPSDASGGGNALAPYSSFRGRWNDFATQLGSDVVAYFPPEPVEQLRQWVAKEAGKRLDDYAGACNTRFAQEAGFPVILSSATPMTRQQVDQLKDELSQCAQDFKNVQPQDSAQSPAFKTLQERVALMSEIVAALAPGAGSRASLTAHPEPDGKHNECPYAHISGSSVENQSGRLDLYIQNKTVALTDLEASLQIKVTNKPDPEDKDATVFSPAEHWDHWSALNLLKLPDVRFDNGKWIAPIPVTYSDGSGKHAGKVYVELQFAAPQPPSLERWNSLSTLLAP